MLLAEKATNSEADLLDFNACEFFWIGEIFSMLGFYYMTFSVNFILCIVKREAGGPSGISLFNYNFIEGSDPNEFLDFLTKLFLSG